MSSTDVTIIGMYFPPRDHRLDSHYKETVRTMLKWLDALLMELPRRTTPLVACDLNDSFGLERTSLGWQRASSAACYASRPARQQWAAGEMPKVLETHHMYTTSAALCADSTFYEQNHNSIIDHFFLPRAITGMVSHVRVLHKAMRALQLIRTKAPRDHAPLMISLSWNIKTAVTWRPSCWPWTSGTPSRSR